MTNNEQNNDVLPYRIENNIIKGRVTSFKPQSINIGKLVFDSMKSNLNVVGQVDPITGIEDTFGQILDSSIKCALWMQEQGIGMNDIISVSSKSNREYFIPCIAAIFIGAIYNPWDDDKDANTIRGYIKLMQPKVIFANEKSAPVILEAIKLEDHQIEVVSFGSYPGTIPFTEILNGHSKSSIRNFQCVEMNPDQIMIILFSSGTTSVPKGVPFTHGSLEACLPSWDGPPISTWMWYSCLHWLSDPILNLRNIIFCKKKIIAPPFEEESVCKIVEKYKVEWLLLTTSRINRLVRYDRFHEYDFSNLLVMVITGSPMYKEAQDMVKKCLPNTMVAQIYGASELCNIIALQSFNSTSGSAGFVNQNCEVKIIDMKTGEPLGPYQKGEICGKTAVMLSGYYKNPEDSKKVLDKYGYFRTGDFGYYNEKGEVFVLERICDLIKFRDHLVIPSEIEAVLQSHPAVLEVAVVGMPHPVDHEHPTAFVTKRPGKEVSEEELIDLVANKLTDHCHLRGGIIFLPSLPYTATAKIWKKELKEMLKKMVI